MLDWVNRNGKILLAVRPIQAFAGSFVSLFFAIYLNSLGLPLWQTGLVLSGGLATSTLFNLVAGYLADRMGRRRLLMFFGLMSTAAGLVFTLTNQPMILVVTAVIASMGYGGGFGAAQMLERVILAQCCEDEERTDLYAPFHRVFGGDSKFGLRREYSIQDDVRGLYRTELDHRVPVPDA